jgi:hypothetical protein
MLISKKRPSYPLVAVCGIDTIEVAQSTATGPPLCYINRGSTYLILSYDYTVPWDALVRR